METLLVKFALVRDPIVCVSNLKSPRGTVGMLGSMTSLLTHTGAQPTKWRFLPKNLSQLVIFVIELAFT